LIVASTMFNRKEVNSEESNAPEIDSMQSLKDIFIKNTKLIKDSIERSIASNIPLVKLFFLYFYLILINFLIN
jgi:hypothetical protein